MLTLVCTPPQTVRGARPAETKRCLLGLLELEEQIAPPATPERSCRVQRIAPGAPKRRLELLDVDPAARRRWPSLDFDSVATPRSWMEERRARLWYASTAPATVPEPEGHQPEENTLAA